MTTTGMRARSSTRRNSTRSNGSLTGAEARFPSGLMRRGLGQECEAEEARLHDTRPARSTGSTAVAAAKACVWCSDNYSSCYVHNQEMSHERFSYTMVFRVFAGPGRCDRRRPGVRRSHQGPRHIEVLAKANARHDADYYGRPGRALSRPR